MLLSSIDFLRLIECPPSKYLLLGVVAGTMVLYICFFVVDINCISSLRSLNFIAFVIFNKINTLGSVYYHVHRELSKRIKHDHLFAG